MNTYELRTGQRRVGLREAHTPQQAVVDYVRSLGCRDDEIMRLGPDAVSWRGAVYKAVPISEEAAAEQKTRSSQRPSRR